MERIQAKSGRWYLTDDGVYVPSVTTILQVYPKGDRFLRWMGDSASYEEAIAKRDTAGDRGTTVHQCIAYLLAGETVTMDADVDPKVPKFIQGFLNWWHEWKPTLIDAEFSVVSKMGYAGTADILVEAMGCHYLIDVKTSAACYPSYHLQTAAYAAGAREGGHTVDQRGILLLKTTTKKGWSFIESEHTWLEDWDAFTACQKIFHYEYGIEPELYAEKEQTPLTFSLEA